MIEYSTIDLGLINFRLYNCAIGINVSGGIDSALLLFLLMKHSRQRIHAFTISSEEKFRINSRTAVDVINRCIDLTGNFNIEHHTIYQQTQNESNLHRLPKEFLVTNKVGMIYTGITANPPDDVCKAFNTERIEDRDYELEKPTVFEYERYYNPFGKIHKQQVFELYKKFDLLDTLFPVTRSCEYIKIDNSKVVATNYHCGNCWWCQERLWGFGRL